MSEKTTILVVEGDEQLLQSIVNQLIERELGVIPLDLDLSPMHGDEVIALAHAISEAWSPVDAGELLTRVRGALPPPPALTTPERRKLVIDFDTRRAIIGSRTVRLSRKEIELVRILAAANGAVVSHNRIVEQVWGRVTETDHINLRVLAWQVRRKIEPNVAVPRYLIAEPGEGYRLKLD